MNTTENEARLREWICDEITDTKQAIIYAKIAGEWERVRYLEGHGAALVAVKQRIEEALKQTAPEPEKHWAQLAFDQWWCSERTPQPIRASQTYLAGVKAALLHAKEKLCHNDGRYCDAVTCYNMQQRLQQAADSVPEGK